MKHIKEFLLNENENNNPYENYIIGKKIKNMVDIPEFGDHNLPSNERFYGRGIETEDGYKLLYYGGGCSGEDCNTCFIVSPDNKLLATYDF